MLSAADCQSHQNFVLRGLSQVCHLAQQGSQKTTNHVRVLLKANTLPHPGHIYKLQRGHARYIAGRLTTKCDRTQFVSIPGAALATAAVDHTHCPHCGGTESHRFDHAQLHTKLFFPTNTLNPDENFGQDPDRPFVIHMCMCEGGQRTLKSLIFRWKPLNP